MKCHYQTINLLLTIGLLLIHVDQSTSADKIISRNLTTSLYPIKLDYFRPQSDDSRLLEFYSNLEFFENDGPIYIYINNGDGTLTTQWITSGLMYEIAAETNGALYTADHRYFQINTPTQSASFEDLTFLTVEQTLLDIAYFIDYIKRVSGASDTTKIILWGSGYGATIATWAKQKYPHLIHGVWSSSGIFTTTNFTAEPYRHLSDTIESVGGSTCAENVENAFSIIDAFIWFDYGERIQEVFNLCEPVNTQSDLDIATFFDTIILYIIDYLNMYHKPGLEAFCDNMLSTASSNVELLGTWLNSTFLGDATCFDFSYKNRIEVLKNANWSQPGTDSGGRQWIYLRCTQLGLFEVTARANTIFGTHISEAYQYYSCREILDSDFTFNTLVDNIHRLNIAYGGKNPRITNVIFTNGLLDPWINYGITEYDQPDSYVFNINDYARSADLESMINFNTPELSETQDRIREIIIEWVTT